jgi:hypothetical protein
MLSALRPGASIDMVVDNGFGDEATGINCQRDSLNHEPTESTLRGGGANEWPSGSDAHPFRSWDLSSGPCKLPTAMARKLQATLDIFGL